MESATLKVCVMDEVRILERASKHRARPRAQRAYFQPEFVFTMPVDTKWAPARSRAPSVMIDFELVEADVL